MKAFVFNCISFFKQKQLSCARLLEEMGEYIKSQRPRSLLAVILHSTIAYQVYFQGGKKPSKGHEVDESKGKDAKLSNASKTQDAKKENLKEKGYKEKSKLSLSLKVLDQYCKEGKCFKCGECGHIPRECLRKP